MPPSLVDWVSEDHLVWTVLGVVDQMNLDGFYGAYRADGLGQAAYDPAMMVVLLRQGHASAVSVAVQRQGVDAEMETRAL